MAEQSGSMDPEAPAIGDSAGRRVEQAGHRAGNMADRAAERVRAAGDVAEDAATRLSGPVDDMTDSAREAPDRARDMAERAVESGRESSASLLDDAASRLDHYTASGESGVQTAAAEKAARGMHDAANYLREHEAAEIWEDVEVYVRQHPGRSVLMAAAAGLLVGRVLR